MSTDSLSSERSSCRAYSRFAANFARSTGERGVAFWDASFESRRERRRVRFLVAIVDSVAAIGRAIVTFVCLFGAMGRREGRREGGRRELDAMVGKGTDFNDDISVVVVGWVYLDGGFILEKPMSEGGYVLCLYSAYGL